ncbi:unnamed protein product [Sphagnum balticum]
MIATLCVCVCMSPLLSDEPRIRGTYMALRERARGMKEVLQKVEESYLPDMLHRQRADMKKRHMYGRQRAKEMRERRQVQQHYFFFFFFRHLHGLVAFSMCCISEQQQQMNLGDWR